MVTSPLRYPGGKAKLFPYFSELIKTNQLFGCEYCEPYAGGAGLAIQLLTLGYVDRISINDIDPSIYCFWHAVISDTDRLCRLIEATDVTVDEWHNQKAIWDQNDVDNPTALGFSAFFLNRTNRSGIIEGAGPIGGYAQSGKWKIDVRFNKGAQIKNLRMLARYAEQITVSNLDALEFFKRSLKKKNTLTYLDPPYYVKGHKLYKNFYEHDDHAEIATALSRNPNATWIVSYDDVPEIREFYRNFAPVTYSLNYSAGSKAKGSEVIFLSDSLIHPDVEGFSVTA